MNKDLKSMALKMEDMNNQLLGELDRAKNTIEELVKEKVEFAEDKKNLQKFLSKTVHSVVNSLTILRLNLGNSCPSIGKEQKQIFDDEIVLIDETMQQLLRIFEIELNTSLFHRVDLSSLSKEAVRKFCANAHDFSIDIDDEVFVNANENDLFLVLENILSNAQKYTPKKKKISISLKLVKEKVFLKISDEGKGIPKNELGKIFQEFWRSSQEKKNRRGSGLGLHLVKKIVKKHNGQIKVKSEAGQGTSFIVILDGYSL